MKTRAYLSEFNLRGQIFFIFVLVIWFASKTR